MGPRQPLHKRLKKGVKAMTDNTNKRVGVRGILLGERPHGQQHLDHELKLRKQASRKEFMIVRMLVYCFAALIVLILILPPHWITGTFQEMADEVIKFKKEIAALLIAAFGPWIAAGAAYFFGRENLRDAYQNMRDRTPMSVEEILRSLLVKNLPPEAPRYIVDPSTKYAEVKAKLMDEEVIWFFTYVDKDGKYVATIHEEAVYRYAADRSKYDEFATEEKAEDALTIEDILCRVAAAQNKVENGSKDLGIIKSLDKAVKLTPDLSLYAASEIMDEKDKFVGVVLDEAGKPIGYVTTSGLRRKLMESNRTVESAAINRTSF